MLNVEYPPYLESRYNNYQPQTGEVSLLPALGLTLRLWYSMMGSGSSQPA